MSPQNEPTSPPNNAVHRQRRILVADDNRDAGETLAMLLRLDGHEVHVATDGLEAVEMFGRVHPEVAILDIGMPGLSGHEVAQRIRQQHSDRPVTLIAVTGWGQKADKDRAAASGFDHHFTKPVEPALLSALLQK
ncbi:MAG TPA: response regulator [Steroidobacteraceae bacterium]|nr:response regulator [Steroidobacteraceae bacterium]